MVKLLANGDAAGAEELKAKLEEIGAAVADVEAREADIRAGYVSVISNVGAFGENVVKIGMTRRLEPEDRVRELGDASVPFRFDTHALIFSDDAVFLEGRLHDELRERRVNKVSPRREFLYATPAEDRDLLEKIVGQRRQPAHGAAPAAGRTPPHQRPHQRKPRRWIFSEDPTGPRSVDAFDDAEVALDAVGEGDQRLLVGRALVRRDGLLEAVELDQDGALGDSGVMRHDATATDEGPAASGLDGGTGQLVVSSQLLRV
ncbi:hypothetical protein Mro03_51160 [Microbispora rosea subsp. rosea]|nr:hypothetical protein Mro03_51160 [Microbispora rosea subsp. rosea]